MKNEEFASIELPKYQCHKQVWALKIKQVQQTTNGSGDIVLSFDNERYAPIKLPKEYSSKHNPQPGGYYVVYDDGYKSFSPAESFESGYTLIK